MQAGGGKSCLHFPFYLQNGDPKPMEAVKMAEIIQTDTSVIQNLRLHEYQRKIDCLDYLMNGMKKEKDKTRKKTRGGSV